MHMIKSRGRSGTVLLWNQQYAHHMGIKRQKQSNIFTYGSEFVAAQNATELMMELGYTLKVYMPVDGPVLMLGDDIVVVLNTTVPLSVLKTKHLGIGFHRVSEAIDASLSSATYW